jgi:hypothetical protein
MKQIAVVIHAPADEEREGSAWRLVQAVGSVARQEDAPPFEAVVVGTAKDSSTAQEATALLPPDTVFLEMPGASPAEAINAAAAKTSAPLLAFNDGVSVWSPKKLAFQAASLVRPGLDLTGHREEYPLDEEGVRKEVCREHREEQRTFGPVLGALRRPTFALPTMMIRRAAWARLGGLRDGADYWQDFLLRALRGGLRSFLLEKPMSEVPADRPDWPDPPPTLGTETAEFELVKEHIDALTAAQVVAGLGGPGAAAGTVSDEVAAGAVRAGLYLLYGFLDDCHRIAQSAEGDRDCDYWHALMHRREGDFGNSGYWFARVGRHPVFPALREEALTLSAEAVGKAAGDFRERVRASATWQPSAFGDFVRLGVEGKAGAAAVDLARKVQLAEFGLLLAHCRDRAMAPVPADGKA